MQRENQTFIGIRLDPVLLDAVDKKRALNRLSRSQFIRDAIYESVADLVPRELTYPQDRVGESRGGRPKKSAIKSVEQTPRKLA